MRPLRNAALIAVVSVGAGSLNHPLGAQPSDAHATVSVGTATARRGERAYGVLAVPQGSDSALNIRVAVINGAKAGPVVSFVAGSHGTEYTSIVAMTRLIEKIDPKLLSGTVIVAPLLNVASFEQMVPHINPVDRKGMNAGYPGDPAGTQTARALALVTTQVVKPADVVVDLHGGDLDEDLRPYSYWIRTGKAEQDDASKKLALAFGLDMVIVRDVDVTNAASARSLSGYALSLGKTTLVAEAGRAGLVTPEETAALVNGSLNVLGALKMIARPAHPAATVTGVGKDERVRADSGAMFYATVKRGSTVKKGVKVGWMTDYVGRPIGNVLAPQDGAVTFIRPVPSLSKGATIVTVAQIYGSTPPPYVKP
jgi:predicted deacylase